MDSTVLISLIAVRKYPFKVDYYLMKPSFAALTRPDYFFFVERPLQTPYIWEFQ
jgi:hypothetical protein